MRPEEASPRNKPRRVWGIDMAKPMFPRGGLDEAGTMVVRKRWLRGARMPVRAQTPPVVSGLAAWGGAQAGARRCRAHGQAVKWRAPPVVTPDVQATTPDLADAAAMGEAVTRPTRRGGPSTAVAPPELPARQRIRARLVNARPALMPERRGWWGESGSVLPKGLAPFRHAGPSALAQAQAKLTELRRNVFQPLLMEWLALEPRLASDHAPREARCRVHPAGPRRLTIPGVGPFTATAVGAAVREATPGKTGPSGASASVPAGRRPRPGMTSAPPPSVRVGRGGAGAGGSVGPARPGTQTRHPNGAWITRQGAQRPAGSISCGGGWAPMAGAGTGTSGRGQPAPALTWSQIRPWLAVRFPLPQPSVDDLLACVAWVHPRHHRASLSHNKRRETAGSIKCRCRGKCMA